MPSPFPGMDPYLEDDRLWSVFQHQFVTALYQILLPGLVEHYRLQVCQREYATAQMPTPSNMKEYFIDIRQRSDERLVTWIDFATPTNKTDPRGRAAFHEDRRERRAAGASLVEVDLVLRGDPLLEYSREGLPKWDYAVTVLRATQPERYEIYTTTLRKRLPRFKLPLAPDDRDTVLDLQATFTRCYDQGKFAERIDYSREPTAPLSADDRHWVAELLGTQYTPGNSAPAGELPPDEQIAVAAYHLWEAEGRPQGRDKEHWYNAIEQVRERKGREQ